MQQPSASAATSQFVVATNIPAQPTITYAQPKTVAKFNRCRSIGIGISLLIAASLGVVFSEFDVHLLLSDSEYPQRHFGVVRYGFWVGAVAILAGSFGIAAGLRQTRRMIQAFNIICIVAASLDAIQFTNVVIGIARIAEAYCHDSDEYNRYRSRSDDDCPRVAITLSAVLAVLAFVEAVLAICGSVMCCRATGCSCRGCCKDGTSSSVGTAPNEELMMNSTPMAYIYQPQTRMMQATYAGVPIQCQGQPQLLIPVVQTVAPSDESSSAPPAYSRVVQHQEPRNTVTSRDAGHPGRQNENNTHNNNTTYRLLPRY